MDFEPSFGALGKPVVGVTGLAGALEMLATIETAEHLLFRSPPRGGVVVPLASFDAILDAGKEDKDFLGIGVPRFSLAGEVVLQIWVPGADFEAPSETPGLPAVVSEILMKLRTLFAFSCVFLGAGGVLASVDGVP